MLAISFFYSPHDSATPRDAAWLSQGNDSRAAIFTIA